MSKYFNRSRQEVVGDRGEVLISILLARYLNTNKMYAATIDNYRFRTSYGSCEIDQLLICEKGIFVIEVKDWIGTVSGSIDSNEWSHVYPKVGRLVKKTEQNPVVQNRTHVNQLRKLFNKDYPIYSVVVFIKTRVKSLGIPNVIHVNEFIPYLDHINPTGPKLSKLDIDCIVGVLSAYRKIDNVSAKEHIRNVQKLHK